jgi:hypothetical protein
MLFEKGVKHLILSWLKRPIDETFTLQMNDESNYFRNKYTGPLLTYTVNDLYRNTEYKFRVIFFFFYVKYLFENFFLFSYLHIIKKVKVIFHK